MLSKFTKQRRLQIIFLVISLLTLPCYGLGWLFIRLNDRMDAQPTLTLTVTSTNPPSPTTGRILPTRFPTFTPTITPSQTQTITITPSPTMTEPPTVTPSLTETLAPSPTDTPTLENTSTATLEPPSTTPNPTASPTEE